jgi:hypothetical protein
MDSSSMVEGILNSSPSVRYALVSEDFPDRVLQSLANHHISMKRNEIGMPPTTLPRS